MSSVNLPESYIKRAKALTGLAKKDAAVRALIDRAEAAERKSPAKSAARTRKAVQQADTLPAIDAVQELRRKHRKSIASKRGLRGYSFLQDFTLDELRGPT